MQTLNNVQQTERDLEDSIKRTQPLLVIAKQNAGQLAERIERETAQADDEEVRIRADEESLASRRKTIQLKLSELEDMIAVETNRRDNAIAAIKIIKKSEIAKLRSLGHAPKEIAIAFAVICIMKDITARVTKNAGSYSSLAHEDYWPESKILLNDPKFFLLLVDFEGSSISADGMEKISLLEKEAGSFEEMLAAAKAKSDCAFATLSFAVGTFRMRWANDELERRRLSAQEKIKEIEQEALHLQERQGSLKIAREQIEVCKARRTEGLALQEQYEKSLALHQAKLDRAKHILTMTQILRHQWIKRIKTISEQFICLKGDAILLAISAAYLGGMSSHSQAFVCEQARRLLKSFKLPFSASSVDKTYGGLASQHCEDTLEVAHGDNKADDIEEKESYVVSNGSNRRADFDDENGSRHRHSQLWPAILNGFKIEAHRKDYALNKIEAIFPTVESQEKFIFLAASRRNFIVFDPSKVAGAWITRAYSTLALETDNGREVHSCDMEDEDMREIYKSCSQKGHVCIIHCNSGSLSEELLAIIDAQNDYLNEMSTLVDGCNGFKLIVIVPIFPAMFPRPRRLHIHINFLYFPLDADVLQHDMCEKLDLTQKSNSTVNTQVLRRRNSHRGSFGSIKGEMFMALRDVTSPRGAGSPRRQSRTPRRSTRRSSDEIALGIGNQSPRQSFSSTYSIESKSPREQPKTPVSEHHKVKSPRRSSSMSSKMASRSTFRMNVNSSFGKQIEDRQRAVLKTRFTLSCLENDAIKELSNLAGDYLANDKALDNLDAIMKSMENTRGRLEANTQKVKRLLETRAKYATLASELSFTYAYLLRLRALHAMYYFSYENFLRGVCRANAVYLSLSEARIGAGTAHSVPMRDAALPFDPHLLHCLGDLFAWVSLSISRIHFLSYAIVVILRLAERKGLIKTDHVDQMLGNKGTQKDAETGKIWLENVVDGDASIVQGSVAKREAPAVKDVWRSVLAQEFPDFLSSRKSELLDSFVSRLQSSKNPELLVGDAKDRERFFLSVELQEATAEMTSPQMLYILYVTRRDRFPHAVVRFVKAVCSGEKIAIPASKKIRLALHCSSPVEPVLLLVSRNVSASINCREEVVNLANNSSIALDSVSFGGELAPAAYAKRQIIEAIDRGHWVLLNDIHLAPTWMPRLCEVVHGINVERVHEQFRLWMISAPVDDRSADRAFPPLLIEASVVLHIESSITGAQAIVEDLGRNNAADAFQGQMRALLLHFHSLMCHSNFRPGFAWQMPYRFTPWDLRTAVTLLSTVANDRAGQVRVRTEVLQLLCPFILSDATYGSHIVDPSDAYRVRLLFENALQRSAKSPKAMRKASIRRPSITASTSARRGSARRSFNTSAEDLDALSSTSIRKLRVSS